MSENLLLESLFKDLLTEAVQSARLIEAMKKRLVARIYYDGDETVRAGYRLIEIYALGTSKVGNPVIRAWQVSGVSDTPHGDGVDKLKEMPGWRFFNTNNIDQFQLTKTVYDVRESVLHSTRPNYNPQDKQMQHVEYAITADKDTARRSARRTGEQPQSSDSLIHATS
jgi:hypothetical protein